jgi:hypothetical protein
MAAASTSYGPALARPAPRHGILSRITWHPRRALAMPGIGPRREHHEPFWISAFRPCDPQQMIYETGPGRVSIC